MGDDGHENEIAKDVVAVRVDLAGGGRVEGRKGEGETTDELLVAEGCDENFKESPGRLDMQPVTD